MIDEQQRSVTGVEAARQALVAIVLAVAIIALLELVGAVRLGWTQTTGLRDPKVASNARAEDDLHRCIETRLRRSVPEHAKVVVAAPSVHDWQYQRLTELVTPWFRVTTRQEPGVYVLSTQPESPGCAGIGVKVSRL
jgi:hypothetical protein